MFTPRSYDPARAAHRRQYRLPMRYTYRCNNCRATAPDRREHRDARQDRDDHRERAHHGLRPDDEIIETPGIVVELARAVFQPPQPRPLRRTGPPLVNWRHLSGAAYWQQAVRLLGIGVGVIVLLAIIRHLI